jgi:hypothetical protein
MIFVASQGETPSGTQLIRITGQPKHLASPPEEFKEGVETWPENWRNPVKIAQGKMDLRYRARYWPWSATFEIHFLANIVSASQVLNLVNLAGTVEGLCEWRPGSPKNNTGDCGRFRVESSE